MNERIKPVTYVSPSRRVNQAVARNLVFKVDQRVRETIDMRAGSFPQNLWRRITRRLTFRVPHSLGAEAVHWVSIADLGRFETATINLQKSQKTY